MYPYNIGTTVRHNVADGARAMPMPTDLFLLKLSLTIGWL